MMNVAHLTGSESCWKPDPALRAWGPGESDEEGLSAEATSHPQKIQHSAGTQPSFKQILAAIWALRPHSEAACQKFIPFLWVWCNLSIRTILKEAGMINVASGSWKPIWTQTLANTSVWFKVQCRMQHFLYVPSPPFQGLTACVWELDVSVCWVLELLTVFPGASRSRGLLLQGCDPSSGSGSWAHLWIQPEVSFEPCTPRIPSRVCLLQRPPNQLSPVTQQAERDLSSCPKPPSANSKVQPVHLWLSLLSRSDSHLFGKIHQDTRDREREMYLKRTKQCVNMTGDNSRVSENASFTFVSPEKSGGRKKKCNLL